MTAQMLTKMFTSSTMSEKDLEMMERKLETAENFERAHKPLKKFPRQAL